jgi:hypothetical protein
MYSRSSHCSPPGISIHRVHVTHLTRAHDLLSQRSENNRPPQGLSNVWGTGTPRTRAQSIVRSFEEATCNRGPVGNRNRGMCSSTSLRAPRERRVRVLTDWRERRRFLRDLIVSKHEVDESPRAYAAGVRLLVGPRSASRIPPRAADPTWLRPRSRVGRGFLITPRVSLYSASVIGLARLNERRTNVGKKRFARLIDLAVGMFEVLVVAVTTGSATSRSTWLSSRTLSRSSSA